MNEEMTITETEEVETISVPEEIIEPEPEKVFDIIRIEATYKAMAKRDATKMVRTDYAKYQWLEQKLVDAGIIGEQAWEKEFEVQG